MAFAQPSPTDDSALSAYVSELTVKRCNGTPFARFRSGVTVDEISAYSSAGALQENCRSSTDSAGRQAGVAFIYVHRLPGKSLHSVSSFATNGSMVTSSDRAKSFPTRISPPAKSAIQFLCPQLRLGQGSFTCPTPLSLISYRLSARRTARSWEQAQSQD